MAEVKDRIAGLMFKHLKKELSPEDEIELNAWISSSETNRELFEKLTNEESFHTNVRELYSYKTEAWKRIESEIEAPKVVPMRRARVRWVAAASIIVMLGVGGYLVFFRSSFDSAQDDGRKVATMHDVAAPKETRAVITLADGTKVYLDSVNNGTIAQQNDVNVVKSENGAISYQPLAASKGEVVYNTLFNPRGSKVIDMTLSDGSHVWLNAGSSVKYPVAFIGTERKVEITGEAYFEVAHDASKPFIVSKGETSVTVLGTHFNVNAYDDEESLKVTLLEGSVRVGIGNPELGIRKGKEVTIKPGEQAVVGVGNSELGIRRNIDLDEVMAWKNGLFSFNNTDLKTVMRQVARWYDVDVEYQGNIPSKKFVGEIDRTMPVSKVLQMMEYIGVKFKIEGKKVTVMQ
jgi:ferric-dicitrate binding protein FerR (iron transport regulator)